MDAAFIFLMFVLKLPIAALLYLVWWSVRAVPEPEADGDEDGGSKVPPDVRPHPRPSRPPRPRRGPHGDPPAPAPARKRPVVAKGRRVGT